MDIKEIALKIAHRKCTSYDHVPVDMGIRYSFSDSHLIEFAEALVAEIQRRGEPVAWKSENSTVVFVPSGTAHWSMDLPNLLFTFPPSTEALEDKVAEACAYVADEMFNRAATGDEIADAISSGEWKRFRKGE